MKARDFEPTRLHVEAFAKADMTLEGVWPLAQLERLASSTVAAGESDPIAWHARGESRAVRGGQPQIWLHIEAMAAVKLECQRCLAPVAVGVDVKRSFLFVHGEEAAAALDSDTEDDVLAMTRALDVRELIEDELLLALPLVPRHEVCPQPLMQGESPLPAEEEAPHPFAALAALKRGGLPN